MFREVGGGRKSTPGPRHANPGSSVVRKSAEKPRFAEEGLAEEFSDRKLFLVYDWCCFGLRGRSAVPLTAAG